MMNLKKNAGKWKKKNTEIIIREKVRVFPLEKPLIPPGLGLVLLLFTTEYALQKSLPCSEKSRAESPFLLHVCTRELNSPIWLVKY